MLGWLAYRVGVQQDDLVSLGPAKTSISNPSHHSRLNFQCFRWCYSPECFACLSSTVVKLASLQAIERSSTSLASSWIVAALHVVRLPHLANNNRARSQDEDGLDISTLLHGCSRLPCLEGCKLLFGWLGWCNHSIHLHPSLLPTDSTCLRSSKLLAL